MNARARRKLRRAMWRELDVPVEAEPPRFEVDDATYAKGDGYRGEESCGQKQVSMRQARAMARELRGRLRTQRQKRITRTRKPWTEGIPNLTADLERILMGGGLGKKR